MAVPYERPRGQGSRLCQGVNAQAGRGGEQHRQPDPLPPEVRPQQGPQAKEQGHRDRRRRQRCQADMGEERRGQAPRDA